jgi:hypothetical protein
MVDIVCVASCSCSKNSISALQSVMKVTYILNLVSLQTRTVVSIKVPYRYIPILKNRSFCNIMILVILKASRLSGPRADICERELMKNSSKTPPLQQGPVSYRSVHEESNLPFNRPHEYNSSSQAWRLLVLVIVAGIAGATVLYGSSITRNDHQEPLTAAKQFALSETWRPPHPARP